MEVLQLLLSQVAEPDLAQLVLVVQERRSRMGEEHLPTVTGGADAGGAIDRETDVTLTRKVDRAGVDSHSHPKLGMFF